MRTGVLVVFAALVALGPVVPAQEAPGVSQGPENILVHDDGWEIELVDDALSFPTHIAFKDGDLLVVEAHRYHYVEPYDPDAGACDKAAGQLMNCGELTQLTLANDGSVADRRTLADGLADPVGLEVAPNGDVYFTQYNDVSRVPDVAFDDSDPTVEEHSTGYPSQTFDFAYAPVTGTHITSRVGEALNPNTTGPMGLAFHPDTGQLQVTTGYHGPPPDDPVVRDVSGLGYDNPYSSSVIAPGEGEISPDDVAARACRSCFDLGFAPDGHDHDGELFATENVGPYRMRASPGENRTPLEGSTPADWNLLDGVNHVDLSTGQITRVVSFRVDGVIAGVAPTGIAFAPSDFEGGGSELFLTLMSGFVPMTDDRGQVVIAHPDFTTGVGQREYFVSGLDHPIDLAFAPDGSMYVIEFFDGQLWRFSHTGASTTPFP